MERLCKKCNKTKDENFFSPTHLWCRECKNAYMKAKYPSVREKQVAWKRDRRNRLRTLINSAKENPCKDCGIKYPTYVMQFDHLPRFKKSFDLSRAACGGYKESTVLAEIAKCDLLCSNCHAIRTEKRRLEASS